MEHTMKLSDPWFDHVKVGVKTYEGRKMSDKIESIRPGDYIVFSHASILTKEPFKKKVVEVLRYKTFEDALKYLGLERVLPGVSTLEEGIAIYEKYVSTQTQNKVGVAMIELETDVNLLRSECKACSRKQEKSCVAVANRYMTSGCCHCLDKRTVSESQIRYIDGVGDINSAKYGCKFPRDIAYCPSCKDTKESSAELDIKLLKAVLKKNPEYITHKWATDLLDKDPYLFNL